MPKATKIVIEFDDGSVWDVDPAKAGSIFTSEAKAKKCGHNPPYEKPPKPKEDAAGTDSGSTTLMAAEAEAGGCYLVNGVIVCP